VRAAQVDWKTARRMMMYVSAFFSPVIATACQRTRSDQEIAEATDDSARPVLRPLSFPNEFQKEGERQRQKKQTKINSAVGENR